MTLQRAMSASFADPGAYSIVDTDTFLNRVETRRRDLSDALDTTHRALLGQFFTPLKAANFIAEMVVLPDHGVFRVLDPGAGIGSLSAALVARVIRERPWLSISICAIELDPFLAPHLEQTLQECRDLAVAAGVELSMKAISNDLVSMATGWERELFDRFNVVVMNPPYRKIGARSVERRSLAALGVDSPNLYSTFLAIGALSLVRGGQLIAITPRSFTNGPYFNNFRRFFLDQVAFDHFHIFASRSTVFSDAAVLQENIIFSAWKQVPQDTVRLSVSHGHTDDAVSREVPYAEVVRLHDRHQFIHLPSEDTDAELMNALPCTLTSTGLQVSTGKVVDFRAREYLLNQHNDDAVPLIYPRNIKYSQVVWPLSIWKPQALAVSERTQKLLLPNDCFLLVKRFSAKEERRRVVAAISDPATFPNKKIAFENHLDEDLTTFLPKVSASG